MATSQASEPRANILQTLSQWQEPANQYLIVDHKCLLTWVKKYLSLIKEQNVSIGLTREMLAILPSEEIFDPTRIIIDDLLVSGSADISKTLHTIFMQDGATEYHLIINPRSHPYAWETLHEDDRRKCTELTFTGRGTLPNLYHFPHASKITIENNEFYTTLDIPEFITKLALKNTNLEEINGRELTQLTELTVIAAHFDKEAEGPLHLYHLSSMTHLKKLAFFDEAFSENVIWDVGQLIELEVLQTNVTTIVGLGHLRQLHTLQIPHALFHQIRKDAPIAELILTEIGRLKDNCLNLEQLVVLTHLELKAVKERILLKRRFKSEVQQSC